MKREKGFYFVKSKIWIVAEYVGDGEWYVTGYSGLFRDSNFEIIKEVKIIMPDCL